MRFNASLALIFLTGLVLIGLLPGAVGSTCCREVPSVCMVVVCIRLRARVQRIYRGSFPHPPRHHCLFRQSTMRDKSTQDLSGEFKNLWSLAVQHLESF